MNKSKIKKDLIDFFPRIAEDTPISMAYLYGSFLDDSIRTFRDIDIALVIKNMQEKRHLFRLEMQTAVCLDERLKLTFDVRTINEAPLRVKGEIVTNGDLIYCEDEEFRVEFETYVRDMYFDFLPSLRLMRDIYFDSIKTGGFIGQT